MTKYVQQQTSCSMCYAEPTIRVPLCTGLGVLTCMTAAADSAGMAHLVETSVTTDWQLWLGLVPVALHGNLHSVGALTHKSNCQAH